MLNGSFFTNTSKPCVYVPSLLYICTCSRHSYIHVTQRLTRQCLQALRTNYIAGTAASAHIQKSRLNVDPPNTITPERRRQIKTLLAFSTCGESKGRRMDAKEKQSLVTQARMPKFLLSSLVCLFRRCCVVWVSESQR